MVLVNTGLRRAIGAGINKGLIFFAPLKTELTLSRGTGNPTFTRATTAYVTDFEGLLKQVPSGCARFTGARMVRNLLAATEAMDGGSWLKGATTTVTPGITAPDGTATAYQVDLPAVGDNIRQTAVSSVVVGNRICLSIFIKADSPGTIRLLEGNAGTPDATVNVTTEWQRFSSGSGNSGTVNPQFYCGRTSAGMLTKIYVWHPSLENNTGASNQAPSEYVSVGVLSAPYHGAGADGIKYFATENGNSVASNVVTEATGAAIADATLKGYFAEGQRQNRCIHAQDFTNAAWVSGGGGIAVTPNTAVAPDGTTTADTLTASGANGTLIQDLGVVASAAKAGGLYLKRKTGTGNIDLTLDGGSTWTTVAVTSSWLLLEKTQTLADEDFGIRIVTSGDEVYAWTAQVETATFISSPIPTTTAAVTRNADVLTYASSGNLLGTAGTVYVECCWKAGVAGTGMVCNATTNRGYVFRSGLTLQQYDGTTSVNGPSVLATQPTLQKQAGSWGGSSMVSASAGVLGTPGSFDGDMNADANFTIGWRGAGVGGESHLCGSIRNVRVWNKALTDAQLQALTT